MKRRSFLAAASSVTIGAGFVQAASPKRRVAVIGHTGRGNFGHGLDTVWQQIPETEICAVVDGDENGLARELKKLDIDRGYTDYRRMLMEVRPEFVSVCPRHADQHYDMALASIEAGVKGLYVEKPFCRTPAEADELIAACEMHGATIAVAHRNRYHPALNQIDRPGRSSWRRRGSMGTGLPHSESDSLLRWRAEVMFGDHVAGRTSHHGRRR